jgi:hypothetical protein
MKTDEYQVAPADLFDTLQPGDKFTARFASTRSTYKVTETGFNIPANGKQARLIWVHRYILTQHRYTRRGERWTKEMFVGRRSVARG